MEDRASDALMGRFFVVAQALLLRGEMSLRAIAEIRNELYGPTVVPLDVDEIPTIERDLRPAPVTTPVTRTAYRLAALAALVSLLALGLSLYCHVR